MIRVPGSWRLPPLSQLFDRLLQVSWVNVFQRIRRRALELFGVDLHGKFQTFQIDLGVGMPDAISRVVFPTPARQFRLERDLLGEKINRRRASDERAPRL
jgi:hypothetical protein